jgi:hypothetical protein
MSAETVSVWFFRLSLSWAVQMRRVTADGALWSCLNQVQTVAVIAIYNLIQLFFVAGDIRQRGLKHRDAACTALIFKRPIRHLNAMNVTHWSRKCR